MKQLLKILCVKGQEIIPYISDLAQLRIDIFKNYPYLYEGDFAYELNYLKTYTNCSESFMVLVLDGKNVIGASTALPLLFETAECQKPFFEANLEIQNIFYLGESLLLPKYRGQGIYKIFFEERENAARKYGCKITTFCAVERQMDDPRKPVDYVSMVDTWHKFGYKKHPEICAYYKWKEIGESAESEKPMIFWMKNV